MLGKNLDHFHQDLTELRRKRASKTAAKIDVSFMIAGGHFKLCEPVTVLF